MNRLKWRMMGLITAAVLLIAAVGVAQFDQGVVYEVLAQVGDQLDMNPVSECPEAFNCQSLYMSFNNVYLKESAEDYQYLEILGRQGDASVDYAWNTLTYDYGEMAEQNAEWVEIRNVPGYYLAFENTQIGNAGEVIYFGCGDTAFQITIYDLDWFGAVSQNTYDIYDVADVLVSVAQDRGICPGGTTGSFTDTSQEDDQPVCSNPCAGVTADMLVEGSLNSLTCSASCFAFGSGAPTYAEAQDCINQINSNYQSCLAQTGQEGPLAGLLDTLVPDLDDLDAIPDPIMSAILGSVVGAVLGGLVALALNILQRGGQSPLTGGIPDDWVDSGLLGIGKVSPEVRQLYDVWRQRGWVYHNGAFTPQSGAVNANGDVWYQPPWEEGGPYWMSSADYQFMQNQLRQGKQWDPTYGWKSPEDLEYLQEARERQLDAQADAAEVRHQEINDILQRRDRIDAAKENLERLQAQQEQDNLAARSESHIFRQGLYKTSREVFTGIDGEGKTSYAALGVRVMAASVSGGWSEVVFTSGEGLHRVNDRLDAGDSLVQAINQVGTEMLIEEGLGRVVMAGGGALAKSGLRAAKGGFNALDNMIGRGIKKRIQEIPEHLKGPRQMVTEALRKGDDQAVLDLYRGVDGRKNLIQLEQHGSLTASESNQINRVVSRNVMQTVDNSIDSSLRQLEAEHAGLQVKQVMVGNSGSKPGSLSTPSINTDTDVTLHLEFDQRSLQETASQKYPQLYQTDPQQAVQKTYNDLSGQFQSLQEAEMDRLLKEQNLTRESVDFSSYDRFGASTKADAYPEGWNKARMAVQGETRVYSRDPNGVMSSYDTSGQALVDQNALTQAKLEGDLSGVDLHQAKSSIEEMQGLVAQQMKALDQADTAEKASKAVLRLDYAYKRMETAVNLGLQEGPVPELPRDLVDLSKAIRTQPQNVDQLRPGTEEEFIKWAREAVEQYGRFFNSDL